jgi:hypothetical protein
MPAEAELILFGIQAALRINQQFRHAFADSTRSHSITLPLPNFPAALDRSSMESFYRFGDGKEFSVTNLRVRELLNKLSAAGDLAPDEDQEFCRLFREHNAVILAGGPGLVGTGDNPAGLTDQDILYLVTIRQWREGHDPNPTILRRMAGTLVNIAVDYVVEMPGVISTNTARGKALLSFLGAFEHIDFAEDGRAQILEGLFTAALETLRDHPDMLAEDDRTRELLHDVAKGLYEDSAPLLAAPGQTLTEKERIRAWAQMVFGSVLKSVGTTVFAEPEKFLGISGATEGELVSGVGRALLTSLMAGDGLNLSALFTRESLDRVAKAGLLVVGSHPELVTNDNLFLKKLIGAAATDLARSTTCLGRAFLPDALRIILESTAGRLELLMPEGKDRPEKHLLVVAGREVLEQLAAPPPPGATWTLHFGSAEALQVLEVVVGEVMHNPGWLEKKAGDAHSLLGEVTREVLATLRTTAPAHLARQTGLAILEAALAATGRRLEFLEKNQQERRLIGLAVEAVLTTVFHPQLDPRAAWVLARDAAVERLVAVTLEKLAEHGVTEARIMEAQTVLQSTAQLLAAGDVWSPERFALQLEQRLA